MAFLTITGRHITCLNGSKLPVMQRKIYPKYLSGIRWYTECNVRKETIRIGCASGFWGDTAVSAPQLIHKGNIDFLVFDYLSEITMSLLTAVKQKMPDMGYTPDFVQVAMAPNIKHIKDRGIKVVSNAGGINPLSCGKAIQEVAKKANVDLKVAVVTGDDLMPQKEEISRMGITDMSSGITFPQSMNSMTAYLGAGAISRALDMGADIVVTGRCTDSALVLGPLMHQFKWSPENYQLMASGSVAGHLIECGAQATGGVFTDWHLVNDWHNIGFPIVECKPDGSFHVTKPPATGGLVSPATCAEQMLYEIGDPQNYTLPDVNCDFSQVSFTQILDSPSDAVSVSGVLGKPPTADYKVCGTYADGYRLVCVFNVGGPKAAEKGRKTVDAILKRVRGLHKMLKMDDFSKVHLQVLGAEDSYGPHATKGDGPREAVIWLAAHHAEKRPLEVLARELAPAGTGMAPGLTGIVGGRPKVSPVMKLFSFLYPKDKLKIEIHLDGETEEYIPQVPGQQGDTSSLSHSDTSQPSTSSEALATGSNTYRLQDLAYTRSGDKGNHCNIGVAARHPAFVPYLRAKLTAEAVDEYMAHVFEERTGTVDDRVIRYEVPGVNGFNFLLKNSLGGGGVSSLRSDPQGKAFGQMLLDFTLDNMPDLKEIQKHYWQNKINILV